MEIEDFRNGSLLERFSPAYGARTPRGVYRIESITPDAINGYPKDEFAAILINEESLSLINFDVVKAMKEYLIDLKPGRHGYYVVFYNGESVAEVQYIHELQNVFIKLTHKEWDF